MWKTVIVLGCCVGAAIPSPVAGKNMPVVSEQIGKEKSELAMSTLNLPSNATSIRADITDGFTCDGKTYGYYADMENECQIFHVCLPVVYPDGRENTFRWSFICPEDTLFSQESFTCVRSMDMSFDCADSARFYELNRNFGAGPDSSLEMHNVDSDFNDMIRKTPTDDFIKKSPPVVKPAVPATTAAPLQNRRRYGDSNLRRKPTKTPAVQATTMDARPIETNTFKKTVPLDIKPLVNRQQFIHKTTNTLRRTIIPPKPFNEDIKPVYEDIEIALKTDLMPEVHEEVKKTVQVPVESGIRTEASHPTHEPDTKITKKEETIVKTDVTKIPEMETSTNITHLIIPVKHEDIKPVVEESHEGETFITKTNLQPQVLLHETDMNQEEENKHVPLITELPIEAPVTSEPLESSASALSKLTNEKNANEMVTLPKESLGPMKPLEPAHNDDKPSITEKLEMKLTHEEGHHHSHPAMGEEMKPEIEEIKPEIEKKQPEMEKLEVAAMKVKDTIVEPMKHDMMMAEHMELIASELHKPDLEQMMPIGQSTESKHKLEEPAEIPTPSLQKLTLTEIPEIVTKDAIKEDSKLIESEKPAMNSEEQKSEIIKAISSLMTQANMEADSLHDNHLSSSTLKTEELIEPSSSLEKQTESLIDAEQPEKLEVPTLMKDSMLEAHATPAINEAMLHIQTPDYIPVQVIMMDEKMTDESAKLEAEIINAVKHHSQEHKDTMHEDGSGNMKVTASDAIVVESPIAEEVIVKSVESLPAETEAAHVVLETDPVEMKDNEQNPHLVALKAEILPMPEEEVQILEEHPHIEMMPSKLESPSFEIPSPQPEQIQVPMDSISTQDTLSHSENEDLPQLQSTFEQIYDIASNLIKTATMSANIEDLPVVHDLNEPAKEDTKFSKSTPPTSDNIVGTETLSDSLKEELPQQSAPIHDNKLESNHLRAEKIGELVERTDLPDPIANRIELSRNLQSNIDPRKRRFLFRSDSR